LRDTETEEYGYAYTTHMQTFTHFVIYRPEGTEVDRHAVIGTAKQADRLTEKHVY